MLRHLDIHRHYVSLEVITWSNHLEPKLLYGSMKNKSRKNKPWSWTRNLNPWPRLLPRHRTGGPLNSTFESQVVQPSFHISSSRNNLVYTPWRMHKEFISMGFSCNQSIDPSTVTIKFLQSPADMETSCFAFILFFWWKTENEGSLTGYLILNQFHWRLRFSPPMLLYRTNWGLIFFFYFL